MDAGTILGLTFGYLAAMIGVFLLYAPIILVFVALLVVAGILQLLLMPFILLVKRLRGRPQTDTDPSWLLDRRSR